MTSPEVVVGDAIDDLDDGSGNGRDRVIEAVLHSSVNVSDVELFEAESAKS